MCVLRCLPAEIVGIKAIPVDATREGLQLLVGKLDALLVGKGAAFCTS